MKLPPDIRKITAVAALCCAVGAAVRCANSTQIAGVSSGKAGTLAPPMSGTASGAGKSQDSGVSGDSGAVQLGSTADANVAADAEGATDAATGSGTLGDNIAAGTGAAATDAPIDYPALNFAGTGATSCKGKFYTTTAAFGTTLTAAELALDLSNGHIAVDDKAQSQADSEIQKSIGVTTYTRVSAAQRTTLKAAGFNYADYAIFATQMFKAKQGQTFTFDAPLPVFPWPAAASRYSELAAGPKTWTANVTGAFTSSVSVVVSLVSSSPDTQVLTFTTTIAKDTSGGLYSIFPLPHIATFTVSSTTLDVREIDSVSIFQNTDNCGSGRETVKMTYKLCTKVSQTQNATFPCQ